MTAPTVRSTRALGFPRRLLVLTAGVAGPVAASVLGFIFVFLPMADTASVTIVRWYKPRLPANQYFDLVSRIPSKSILTALFLTTGLLLVLLVGARRVLGHRRARQGPFRILGRFLVGAAIAAYGLFAAVVLFIWGVETYHLYAADDRVTFLDTCGRCHSVQRSLDYFQTRFGWENTVLRMSEKPSANIGEPEAMAALDYLVAVRSISTGDLVKGRCSLCHEAPGPETVEMDAARLRRAVDRIRALDPRFCEQSEAAAVAAFLARKDPMEDRRPAELQDRFERFCETCHFLDVMLQPLWYGDWREMAVRMQRKVPSLIGENEVLELVPFMEAEVVDPARFRKRYPHSGLRNAWRP